MVLIVHTGFSVTSLICDMVTVTIRREIPTSNPSPMGFPIHTFRDDNLRSIHPTSPPAPHTPTCLYSRGKEGRGQCPLHPAHRKGRLRSCPGPPACAGLLKMMCCTLKTHIKDTVWKKNVKDLSNYFYINHMLK